MVQALEARDDGLDLSPAYVAQAAALDPEAFATCGNNFAIRSESRGVLESRNFVNCVSNPFLSSGNASLSCRKSYTDSQT